jgi:hypothetical protein
MKTQWKVRPLKFSGHGSQTHRRTHIIPIVHGFESGTENHKFLRILILLFYPHIHILLAFAAVDEPENEIQEEDIIDDPLDELYEEEGNVEEEDERLFFDDLEEPEHEDTILRDRKPQVSKYMFLLDDRIGSCHAGGHNFHVQQSSSDGIGLVSDRVNHKVASVQSYIPTARNSLDCDGSSLVHGSIGNACQVLKGLLMMAGTLHQPLPEVGSNAHPLKKRNEEIYRMRAFCFQLRIMLIRLFEKFGAGEGIARSNSARWEFIHCLQTTQSPEVVLFPPNLPELLYLVDNHGIATFVSQLGVIFMDPLCSLLEVFPNQDPSNVSIDFQAGNPSEWSAPVSLMYQLSPETRASAVVSLEVFTLLFSGTHAGCLFKQIEDNGSSIFKHKPGDIRPPFLPTNTQDIARGVNFVITVDHTLFRIPKEFDRFENMPTMLSPSALGRVKAAVKYAGLYVNWMMWFTCLIATACGAAPQREETTEETNDEEEHEFLHGVFQSVNHEHLAALSVADSNELMKNIGQGLVKLYHQVLAKLMKEKAARNKPEHVNFLNVLPRTDTQLENYRANKETEFLQFKKEGGRLSVCDTEGKLKKRF